MALSSSASASSRFSRAFSPSSSLSRLASLAFMPPYWLSQRCQVDSAISRWRQTSAMSAPVASSLLPSASFLMICSGVCLESCHCESSLLHFGASDPHSVWLSSLGSAHPFVDPCPTPRAIGSRGHTLVVGDERAIRRLFHMYLTDAGHTPTEAGDGRDALAQARRTGAAGGVGAMIDRAGTQVPGAHPARPAASGSPTPRPSRG